MDLHNVFIPFLLSSTTVFTVLHGQKVLTQLEVTVYQNHDVTLLCQYIHGSAKDNISQTVSFIKSSPLNYDASVLIRDVRISDQVVNRCDYTTFPSGSYKGQTTLTVLEGSPPVLSIAVDVGIVTAVVLITMITAALGYLFLINRRRRASNTSAYYTTQSPDDLQQGVTYVDATILKTNKVNRSTSPSADVEVEYAAVRFSGRSGSPSLRASASPLALGVHTAQQDMVYAQVKKDRF
ncbi:uncharacterized protein [Pseudorasbora parva]|uniref:uncharacterized protein n=1 Tax=Pseudorasbora parva TaxID=51549 RepID=UPI00351EB6C0